MAIIPRMPSDSFDELFSNLQEAKEKRQPRGMALPHTYLWFFKKVRNRGPWDYKQRDRSLANFGNFNYGATGTTVGIPPDILLMAGGYSQTQAGTSRPEWNYWYQQSPYGDDPQDQFWIQQGPDYANRHGY